MCSMNFNIDQSQTFPTLENHGKFSTIKQWSIFVSYYSNSRTNIRILCWGLRSCLFTTRIVIVLAIRQCAAWRWTLITHHKHSRNKIITVIALYFLQVAEGFKIAFFLHIYFKRVFSYWRRLFWKGTPCFERAEVQGPCSRNENSRQQPPPTDYLLRSLHSGPPLMILWCKWKK